MRDREERPGGKGVGDKGDVGRRDVRQAAPVGRPTVFSVSPFPGCFSLWPSAERIFHVLCLPHILLSFLSGNERNASLGIKEERRLQTAPATPVNGDPHKPIVFPFPSLFAVGGDSDGSYPPRKPSSTSLLLPPGCPSLCPPFPSAFVSTPRTRPRFSLRQDAGVEDDSLFPT